MKEIKEVLCEKLREEAENFKVGDKIYLTGYIYTARDAAHKRIFALIEKGEKLPFDIKDGVIYYAGPTQASNGRPIGSCGPTTSSRMDIYSPKLLDMGLMAMIGKGERNSAVVDGIVRNKGLYLCSIGGAGALACKCIKSCEVVAFEDLGCESVKKLYVDKFPLVVANDIFGGDIFLQGKQKYLIFDKNDNVLL